MTTTTTIPEIERAAITLLARHVRRANSQPLIDWVDQIETNPDYQQFLDRTICDAISDGFHPAPSYDSTDTDQDRVDAREQARIDGYWARAIAYLADGVILFRRYGRPAGDQVTPIMGLGSPLGYQTSSLAARVVTFTDMVINAVLAKEY